MDPQEACPPATVWEQILEEHLPGASTNDNCRHLDGCPRCQAVVERLAGGNTTWLAIAAELRQPVHPLPPHGRRVLEEINQQITPAPEKDLPVPRKKKIMTACIHIERMTHRSSIAATGESATAYFLLKLIPGGLVGAVRPTGLNLALALDVSGSMYEEDGTGVSRLQRVQDAAIAAILKLRPQDTLAIVAFAQNARVLLPPTPIAEKDKIEDVLRRIDRFDIDPGGTAMDEGLALAMTEIEKHACAGKLSQIVVLTDGETSGEQNCRSLAQKAAEKKIHLTLMGVGLDWKASLLKDLANLSHGKWHYIDVQEAQETTRIFAEEFETLAATAFMNVEMRIRPTKDVRIKRIRQVAPEIKELKMEETEDRNLVARLGALRHDLSSRYILDLSLPNRADGKYAVAHLELTYDLGTGRRESSGTMPLEITYTSAGNGYVNAEVMRHIDEIQLKELSDNLQKHLQSNDQQAAQHVAQEIVKKGELIGKEAAKKTQLAIKVLQELGSEGRVTRKTQLAMQDAARLAEMPR
jgi:Ca-activated chloride channel homolog